MQVVHGFPSEEPLRQGQLLSIDGTLILDGWQADSAFSVVVGGGNDQAQRLIDITQECFWIGAKMCRPGVKLGDISHAIQMHAENNGCGVIRDLCGHGVGLKFHEKPDVMHYGHKGTGMLLVPGMVFTIEPMVNMGTWKVFIDADDEYGWEVISGDEKPSAQWEHTFVMTEHGVEILTH